MENDSISSSSSSESKLPLIVGILGFALGAAGLVVGLKAKSAAQAATDEIVAVKSSVADVGNALAGKASTAEVTNLAADLATTKQGIDANNIAFGDAIKALQTVAKKPAPTSGTKGAPTAGPDEYVVAKGDILGSIAKKVGLSLKALQALNPDVDSTKLRIGQKLKTK